MKKSLTIFFGELIQFIDVIFAIILLYMFMNNSDRGSIFNPNIKSIIIIFSIYFIFSLIKMAFIAKNKEEYDYAQTKLNSVSPIGTKIVLTIFVLLIIGGIYIFYTEVKLQDFIIMISGLGILLSFLYFGLRKFEKKSN
jgi:hypothetical protein